MEIIKGLFFLQAWESCELNPVFYLPTRNEFIPNDLEIRAKETDKVRLAI